MSTGSASRARKGEAKISASAKLGELKPEELANPFMLLGKLEASADIALPASLLGDTAQTPQIAGLIEQGYVQQDGSMLRSKDRFQQGPTERQWRAIQPTGGQPGPIRKKAPPKRAGLCFNRC